MNISIVNINIFTAISFVENLTKFISDVESACHQMKYKRIEFAYCEPLGFSR